MGSVAKPRPYRLGHGAYQWADGHAARADARRRFLAAVESIEPRVFAELAELPFAAFASATEIVDPGDLKDWGDVIEWRETLVALAAEEPSGQEGADSARLIEARRSEGAEREALSSLIEALGRWGKAWRLDDGWCLDWALDTIAQWHREPRWRDGRHLVGEPWGGVLLVGEEDRRFRFDHPGWEPTSDTRTEAAGWIRAAFERDLAAYLDRVEALATERGYIPTPEKRPRYDPTDADAWRRRDPFAWLARVQIDDESCAAIGREAGISERAVQQEVDRLAALIGLARTPRVN